MGVVSRLGCLYVVGVLNVLLSWWRYSFCVYLPCTPIYCAVTKAIMLPLDNLLEWQAA